MEKSNRAAWFFFGIASTGFYLIVLVAVVMALTSCAPSEPETDPAYIGIWAGTLTVPNSPPLLLTLEIRRGGTFQDSIASGGKTISKESGTWKVSGDRLIQFADQCQESGPAGKLVLVACSPEPDSTRIDIRNGEWIQSGILAGSVYSVSFRRVD